IAAAPLDTGSSAFGGSRHSAGGCSTHPQRRRIGWSSSEQQRTTQHCLWVALHAVWFG
ncbi:hypothetical protein GQ54DRAFT_300184, partial [Martensiomyces pterosporus]